MFKLAFASRKGTKRNPFNPIRFLCEVCSTPHSIAAGPRHHLTHKTIFNAKAHMYLDSLLFMVLHSARGPVVTLIRNFVAVLAPPFVAAFAISTLNTIAAPYQEPPIYSTGSMGWCFGGFDGRGMNWWRSKQWEPLHRR
jgi:hypothetical protein